MPDRDASTLWYFAYGSNLDPDTFLGRRRMRPLDARVAVLADWRLVFDLPVGRGERGVANLLPAPGESATGVAYRIADADARRLDRTEGVPKAYRRERVRLASAEGARFAAFTYVSPHRQPARKPSRRYLGLLLRGARHHGLPEVWIEHLRRFELAIDERSAQLELFAAPPGRGGTTR
jgi:cation transport regulator ChaC